MQKEIWAKCSLLPSHYEVSNLGNVRYWKDGAPKKKSTQLNRFGYPMIRISIDGNKKDILLHRAVAVSFIENPDSLPIVHHVDYNKANANATNLVWTTNRGNILDYLRRKGNEKIHQYTVSGELIRTYEFAVDVEEFGFDYLTVIFCLNKRKGYRSHKGFIFTYGDRPQQYFETLNWNPAVARPVKQIDANGNVVKIWNSQGEAQKHGYRQGNISQVLIGYSKTYKGYYWEYA